MAGEVTYMNGAQFQAAINAASQAVAGMSPAEAAAALGGVVQESNNGTQIVTFPLTNVTGGQPVTVEAQYAAQLWEYWQTVGAASGTTALGAAAGAAVSWAQGALIGTGEGLAAGGLLTLSVPTAVAMAAPLLGVGLGAALYDSNPELWTKISNSITGVFTKGTQTISALFTKDGQILLPQELVDNIREVMEDEGIGEETYKSSYVEGSYYSLSSVVGEIFPVTSISWRTIGATNISCDGIIALRTSEDIVGIRGYSSTSGKTIQVLEARSARPSAGAPYEVQYRDGAISQVSNSVTHDGLTAYYTPVYQIRDYTYQGQPGVVAPSVQSIIDDDSVADIVWTLVYGQSQGSGYPTGTYKWGSGSSPSVTPTPVYDPSTGNSTPYYPVTLPIGDTPGTTADPEEVPDPTAPLTPIEYPLLDPYITPVVNPEIQFPDTEEFSELDPDELVNPGAENDPIYVPQPNLDPELDPSEVPISESVPEEEGPPPSSGTSPPFIFPVPDVPFPSIVPQGSDTPVPSGSPGFIQVYNPTPSEFIAFGRWLWVTYADATIDKIWNNPFDGVIGAHELYATPSKDGYSTIRSGFLDSGISSIIVRQRYTQINCGSILIPEYWGNYLDYSPYSQAYIYLPFIGIMAIDVDDIVGHAVNVLYHVDSYTGSCIAQITCARTGYSNTLYQFSGDCSVEIPMAGGSQAAIKAAMIGANAYQNAANISAGMSLLGGIGSGLATGIGGALGGNPIGGIAHGIGQAIGGITSAVSQRAYGEAQHTAAMVSQKSTVQHSGSFGASHGAMGIKKPYIFIRRPIQKVVNNYNRLYGYPAHKMVVIGDCTGYLRCREANVQSSLATEEEKSLIEQLLKSGVYVTE